MKAQPKLSVNSNNLRKSKQISSQRAFHQRITIIQPSAWDVGLILLSSELQPSHRVQQSGTKSPTSEAACTLHRSAMKAKTTSVFKP